MKRPVSLIIFIIVIVASVLTILPALFTSDMLLAMLLTGILFLTMILAIIGFVIGLKYRSDDFKATSLNRIGTMGNICLFIIIIILLFLALF